MTSLPLIPLMESIYGALTGESTYTDLVANTYYTVPDNATMPYVKINDITAKSADDKTTNGADTLITLHAFNHARDNKLINEILDKIHEILHNGDITVTGHNLVLLRWDDFLQVDEEKTDNNTTYHGMIRFRALTRKE